jgi:hypothetical protein
MTICVSRTAEQFEVYEKIRATAMPQDRELIAGKQRAVFDKVNSGWRSFASKLMEDYEAVFADMQSSETSLVRTTDQLNLLNECHYDDFLTWKAKLSKISEEARQLELAKQSAHEQNTKTLADVQNVLKNTTEITNRILYEGPLLSECRQEFIDAKTKQLPSGSTEPAYFERRIDAFLSLVGDKPIAAYRVADLGTFADELRFLPQRHTIDPEWHGKSLKEAIEENKTRLYGGRADASEGEQGAVIAEREPHHVFLFGLRVRLRRVLGEAIDRDQASVLRLEPTPPVR